VANGASFIYREDNSRYIGVQFSVEGRDLAGAWTTPCSRSTRRSLPQGYRAGLGRRIHGIHRLAAPAERHSAADPVPDLPAAVRALQQFQIPVHHRARRGAVGAGGRHLALWLTGTPFSVSSGIGFLALFGVSVQTAVVYISYVNELRRGGTARRGHSRRARSCGCARS
jgi:cobalt-zinc-cadmium resistance protein CzcA